MKSSRFQAARLSRYSNKPKVAVLSQSSAENTASVRPRYTNGAAS